MFVSRICVTLGSRGGETSSRGGRSDPSKSVMCSRNSRSCRFSRSVSVSSEARSSRKRLTSADTDVSRSAATIRARRYVSSSTETVIFLMNSQLVSLSGLVKDRAARCSPRLDSHGARVQKFITYVAPRIVLVRPSGPASGRSNLLPGKTSVSQFTLAPMGSDV